MQETGPALATRATRLVSASRNASYDPFTEIDWDVAFDDDQGLYLAPEDLPLYGTLAWEAMRHPARVAYSRHECASLCAAGIWFENILMQLLLRQLYDLPATDGSHRYLLVETADECRHSAMFGEFVRRAGTPSYAVSTVPARARPVPGGDGVGTRGVRRRPRRRGAARRQQPAPDRRPSGCTPWCAAWHACTWPKKRVTCRTPGPS